MSIVEKITNLIPEEKKTDALMTFIFSAIQDYLKSDINDTGVARYLSKEEAEFIFNEISAINDYLKERVITFEEMQSIVSMARHNKKYMPHYKSIESNLYYYDKIAKSALSKIKQITPSDGKPKWIPDYLIFCLLNDAIEFNLPFAKYDFFYNYDFEKVFIIYRKAIIELKKNSSSNDQTLISKNMENVSITMIEKLKKTKFKIAGNSRKKMR